MQRRQYCYHLRTVNVFSSCTVDDVKVSGQGKRHYKDTL